MVLMLWGLATALFFTSNHTAMITSVPRSTERCHRRDLRHVRPRHNLWRVVGTLLLTTAFRYYSGDPTATPTPAVPVYFVQAMNFSFLVGGIMALIAMSCSAMRAKVKRGIWPRMF